MLRRSMVVRMMMLASETSIIWKWMNTLKQHGDCQSLQLNSPTFHKKGHVITRKWKRGQAIPLQWTAFHARSRTTERKFGNGSYR